MNGFLNIDKPPGVMSRQLVDVVKRLLRHRGHKRSSLPKLGHVGTLDPLATGVLVIAVGAATRLIELVHAQPKSYFGTFMIGQRSDTDDVTGCVVEGAGNWQVAVTRERIEAALAEFRGRIEQVPPKFSAVRVAGQRAYRLARRGTPITLEAKPVEIHRLEIAEFSFPILALDIECSSGTYIRALGRDLGERLGCGAVMSELKRTRVGPFVLEQSVELDDLTADSLAEHLQLCRSAVPHFPAYACDDIEQSRIPFGLSFPPRIAGWQQTVPLELVARPDKFFSLLDSTGELLAVAILVGDPPELRPWINLVAKN